MAFSLPLDCEQAIAITHAVDHGLQALNMSFGDQQQDVTKRFHSCTDGVFDAACTAIEYAKSRDVVLVAAAGNYRNNRVAFPARHPDVVAVGGAQYDAAGHAYWNDGYGTCYSSDPDENEECGSNYGSELAVMAPAKDIVSNVIPGDTAYGSFPCGDAYGDCTGTPMSAPTSPASPG